MHAFAIIQMTNGGLDFMQPIGTLHQAQQAIHEILAKEVNLSLVELEERLPPSGVVRIGAFAISRNRSGYLLSCRKWQAKVHFQIVTFDAITQQYLPYQPSFD